MHLRFQDTPMLTRGRTLRAIAAMFIAVALLASSLATTFGALADIQIGGGDTVGVHDSGATPTQVAPGNVAGFYVWLHNNDAANLSTFFLNAAVTDATPVGAYWTHDLANGPWNTCEVSPALKCSFGAFNSGTDIFVVAGFTVPASSTKNCLPAGSSSGIAADAARAHVCVDFQFGSDSGYVVERGKNKSRGDAYHWYDVVYTDTTGDQSAQFPFCDPNAEACDTGLLTVSDSQTLGKNNLQWTKVKAPDGAFGSPHGTTGIAVADNFTFDCPASSGVCATKFLGQWSNVDVNSGQDFADGTEWVQIDIGVYGVAANKISVVYHLYQIGTTWYVETIDTLCEDAGGPASNFDVDQCFWVQSLKGSSSQVTIWTHHNGKLNIG